ncbi:hypothetical protein F511_42710 [Dorcoceras hygrometricum]|uniref:Uncharacterized protein n=1 Tax=Dorcoceras hygrometricum TaxID=472368 RepID=A0A2Z7APR2_9LAMI|nr:hypothetical protein F511_42710 [Dorcoceras hygrometricum]
MSSRTSSAAVNRYERDSGHKACESMVAIHWSQHTVLEHNQITQPAVAKAHKSVLATENQRSHNNAVQSRTVPPRSARARSDLGPYKAIKSLHSTTQLRAFPQG